ncbi:MAG: gluconate 2-dehydrogenase subunit 3 family protein [Segetibacter sp.]|nr:gluconate 2-dehydrogenase subunit 3 family protein [Segetibacter sp.]
MDRRESIKALTLSALSTSLLVNACNPSAKKEHAEAVQVAKQTLDRTADEKANDERLSSLKFFSAEEMATIVVLCDIIIPKDDVSGSATDAKVPDFIEFIVKDKPEFQTPIQGGLRWLNLESFRRFKKSFTDVAEPQRLQIIDEIAYPEKAKMEVFRGVHFFNLFRNLTATGFYTSEIGIKDLGYKGNTPNQWNGVPDEVLKQYGYAYTEKELKECISFT